MKLFDKIQMGFKDLVNRKGRSMLTILAVSIGALLLIVMMGIGDGIINKMKDMIGSFGDINNVTVLPIDAQNSEDPMQITVQTQESSSKLQEVTEEDKENEKKEDTSFKKITEDDLETISKIEGVNEIYAGISTSINSVKLEDKDYIDRNITVIGENTKYKSDHEEDLIAGREISNYDDEILVGENLIKRLGVESAGDLIGKKVTVKIEYPKMQGMEGIEVKQPLEVEGTVVGILARKTYSDIIVMDQDKAEPIASYFLEDGKKYIEEKGYSGITVYPKEKISGTVLSAEITKECGYQTISLEMITKMFDGMSVIVKGILSIAGIIVLVVASLGLVNTITMTLQEKKKMIGVMRSVGGAKAHIRAIFMYQSAMLGIAGGVLGSVLAVVGILISNEYVTKSSGFAITINPLNILVAVVVTLIISIIAGSIPAAAAARLNVVEAVAEE